jgi:proteasome lid subunit RPN8/RPN11
MKIFIDKDEVKKLKQRMLKAYPNERIELMWGKFKKPDEFHIFIFDSIPHKGKRRSVDHAPEELNISSDHASTMGLTLLGSIHSHPDCEDCSPSEFDYDSGIEEGEVISGIATINKGKNGRKSIKIRFWGPLLGVEPRYF